MRRFFRVLMITLTVSVFAFSGLFLIREFTKIRTLINIGDIWSYLALNDSPGARFVEVDPDDFLHSPIPSVGDSLIEIDGHSATRENYFSVFNTKTPAGLSISIVYKSADSLMTTTVQTRSIPILLKIQVVALHGLMISFTVILIIVGLWAFIRRPDSPSVRVLTLFCYSMTLSMLVNRIVIADGYATFQLPDFFYTLMQSLGAFAPAFWLKLQMIFPDPIRFYRRNRILSNVIIYSIPIALSVIYFVEPSIIRIPLLIYWFVFLIAGFIFLLSHGRQAKSFLEKRQTRLVLWGSTPGLSVYLVLALLGFIRPEWFFGLSNVIRLTIFNATSLLLLFLPISFAIAIGRYRLLEVVGRVNRGTRFILVSVLVLIAFFFVLYGIGEIVLANLGIESRTPTIAIILILAIGFAPAQRRFHRLIEDRFYPERVRLRTLLSEFLDQRQRSAIGRGFWEELEQKLLDGLGAKRIYPVILKGKPEAFSAECCEFAPFKVTDPLIDTLRSSNHPLPVDELLASNRIPFRDDQKNWFEERNAAVILPLSTSSELTGFLVLSDKKSGEDYTAEELSLLNTLAAQIAMVAENIELLEEKLEKERLEEQLEIARQVQEGLLPRDLPRIEGFEIAARIRFCLDVAGDYYDIAPMKNDRILLAVGDVAGKGVGPALLMANLQASLRTVKDTGLPLPRIMTTINELIVDNTSPELFITLFVAILEPESKKLCYVNAGHNEPILLRKDGSVDRLQGTGMVLGVTSESEYKSSTLELHDGDTLLMFTDGVSEAMNDSSEEFGEERIAEILKRSMDRSLDDILDLIESSVRDYRAGRTFADDFTLLVLRASASGGDFTELE